MTYRLVISPEAARDLREIERWYSEKAGSTKIGESWHDGLIVALNRLLEDPERFSLARENDRFPYEIRELLYGSGRKKTHRAIFRVVGDCVEVLTIRHHAQRDISPGEY